MTTRLAADLILSVVIFSAVMVTPKSVLAKLTYHLHVFALWLVSLLPWTGPRLYPPAPLPPEEREIFATANLSEALVNWAIQQRDGFTFDHVEIKGLTYDLFEVTAKRLRRDVPSLGRKFILRGELEG